MIILKVADNYEIIKMLLNISYELIKMILWQTMNILLPYKY